VLDGLGLVDGVGSAAFTFERAGGERADVMLAPLTAGAYRSAFADALYGHYPAILPGAPRPLYLASSGKRLWARTLAGGRAVYIGYNLVVRPRPSCGRSIGSCRRIGAAGDRRPRLNGVATTRRMVK
jgi:hypothetical protein